MILCFINNAIITWSKPKQRKAKLSLSDLSTHKIFSFIIHLYCYFFPFLFRFKIDGLYNFEREFDPVGLKVA